MKRFRDVRIGAKLLVLGGLSTGLTALVLTLMALWMGDGACRMSREEIHDLVRGNQEQLLAGIMDKISLLQAMLEEKVSYDLNVARDVLTQAGRIRFARETVRWGAVNQETQAREVLELPRMMLGDTWMGQNGDPEQVSPVVDRVRDLLGDTCTLFQRMNEQGDMLRVVTNVSGKDGKRAIGTFLPVTGRDGRPNPVLAEVLAGRRFVGRAMVVGRWYVTAYEPLRDESGKIFGILYVGVPEASVASLQVELGKIRQMVVGETGYVYVLDPQGNYLISHKGKRDGESIWNARDAGGNLIIQNIIHRAMSLKAGMFDQVSYEWQNPEDPAPREKTVTLGYFAPWKWVIGAGTWNEEIYRGVQIIADNNGKGHRIMMVVMFLSMGVMSLVWWMLARSLVHPLHLGVSFAGELVSGNLSADFQTDRKDEVGVLSLALREMRDRLLGVVEQVQEASQHVASGSEELSATAQSLAQGASEQVSSAEEINASMEEMRSGIGKNSRNAGHTEQIAEGVAGRAREGGEAVRRVLESMKEISLRMAAVGEIARQTNLLALNAAIEAARGPVSRGKAFRW